VSVVVNKQTLLASLVLALVLLNPQGNQVQEALADQHQVVTVNDLFSEVAKETPAFGGMFYDEEGNLNIYLLDIGQRGRAQAAIAAVFGAERIPKDAIRVLPARYSFADLRAWQDQAFSLFAIPGVLSTGIEHKTNMLRVGVQDLQLSDEVRLALRNLGIPQEAVRIEQTDPSVLQPTLRQRVRPVKGGLNIDANNCTLGFNAWHVGLEGFTTASHCTANMGVVDGESFYQTAIMENDFVGVEAGDPPFFTCGDPYFGEPCRYSDVAFAQYGIDVDFSVGFIEKTQVVNTPQIPESVNIVGDFQITAARDALEGEVVNKVGRSSGWTQGVVTAICVDADMGTYIMLCQTEADYESAGGDSGSPVFLIPSPSSDNVTLVGSHWGGRGDAGACPGGCTDEGIPMTTTGVFSPFSQVAGELGALTVTAAAVGGIAELPDITGSEAAMNETTSANYAALAAALTATLAGLAAAAWYARRRWLG
jgi:hypothetical protein